MTTQDFKDYWKCVYANKFALVGYVGSVAYASFQSCLSNNVNPEFFQHYDILSTIIGGLSAGLLIVTFGGYSTYKHYSHTKMRIKENGSVSQYYVNIHKQYCDKVGVKLAAKEANLEDKLRF